MSMTAWLSSPRVLQILPTSLAKVILVACPEDWDFIFSELLKVIRELKDKHRSDEMHRFYQGVIIGSITIVVWLEREKKLEQPPMEKFFKFLLDFILIPSSVCPCRGMENYFSGLLSNSSGLLCRISGASKFFQDLKKRWTTNMCITAEQVLTELCLKRYVQFSLEDKVKISSSYSPSKQD